MAVDPERASSSGDGGLVEAHDQKRDQRARSGPIFFGWYIVAAGMVIQLWFALAWFYGMQIFFTPIIQTFGWSRALVSGAFSLQRLEGSVISPIMGFLVDRVGPRKLMLPGIVVAGLGMIGMSYLRNVWMFYVLVLVISLGFGTAMGIPRTWTVVQWFRRKRGRALGIMSSGAAAAGPMIFLVVWLLDTVGWQRAFAHHHVLWDTELRDAPGTDPERHGGRRRHCSSAHGIRLRPDAVVRSVHLHPDGRRRAGHTRPPVRAPSGQVDSGLTLTGWSPIPWVRTRCGCAGMRSPTNRLPGGEDRGRRRRGGRGGSFWRPIGTELQRSDVHAHRVP